MATSSADIVICGAGIAGVSAAFHLAVRHNVKKVLLVDDLPPLSLTSAQSTECYRNWWPGPGDTMVALMNRSIDILEALAHESGNCFRLNRRGYLFVSADTDRIPRFQVAAEEAARLGAGPVRYHTGRGSDSAYVPSPPEGFEDQPTGADIILDRALIRKYFPYLSEKTLVALHARRCGWFSAQQLGMYMLERAREQGVTFVSARVEGVATTGGRVTQVQLNQNGSSFSVSTPNFVNAAGPMLKRVGAMVGVDLPVFSERHQKVIFNDYLGVVPHDAPLLIWEDPQRLPWSAEEREALERSEELRWLLDEFPRGVHLRPEGGAESRYLLMMWTYDVQPVGPSWPLPIDPYFAETVWRGMTAMIPDLSVYLDRPPTPVVDGGYYTKTVENRPLVGPLPVEGAYVIGALSGFGMMAACGLGELLAAHLTGSALPSYVPHLSIERYQDPSYRELLEQWDSSGQL